MQRAIVIGASGGVGAAITIAIVIATALASRCAEVTGLSRAKDGLDVTDVRSTSSTGTA
ncbi:hypothetical protein [Aliiruegeria sabulilitoris]|uniref:hypothetical protein n=1 Tax=Aliiruegeria sabulilitoris TaxID=1510458 RepID=UPI0012E34F06|nr:hypothetical protein [Aliiruegeria sabulilitoris]